jgi:tight adherence protein B
VNLFRALTPWTERGAVLAVAATAALVVAVVFSDPASPGRVAFGAYVAGLDGQLRFIRARVRGSRVLTGQGIAIGVCVAAATLGEWTALLVVPVFAILPRVVVTLRAERRVARLEEQIEPWLNAIANSLKASPSLGDAIGSTTSLVAAPMSEEVDVLIKEYELGTPLDRALDNLAARGRGRTLGAAVLALKVARRSGGNLTEMLQTTAAALRELARLEGVVRTKTAEGKAQAFVIAVVPVPMVLCIHWSDPRYFEPLAVTFLGNLIVAGAATLWVLAVLASVKILAVEV